MENSKFQFIQPTLKELVFRVSEAPSPHSKYTVEGRIEPQISRYKDETGEDCALVSISLTLGSDDSSAPFYLKAVEEAAFKWENNAFAPGQVETLLNQNAVSLLISYLRPIVSSITGSSKFPPYNLPFINLTK